MAAQTWQSSWQRQTPSTARVSEHSPLPGSPTPAHHPHGKHAHDTPFMFVCSLFSSLQLRSRGNMLWMLRCLHSWRSVGWR
jgi:hypothetical protein